MKKTLWALVSIYLLHACAFAQDTDTIDNSRFNYIGMNMTPMIMQLIPFSDRQLVATGPYFIHFRNYNGNKATRFSLGWRLRPSAIFREDQFFNFANFRIGSEWRRQVNGKWSYVKGIDLVGILGNANLLDSNDNEFYFGLGITWGIEYHITPFISVNIETSLLASILPLGARFVPPVGINLNYIIPAKPHKRSYIYEMLFVK